tara:strand:+ start:3146 stop:4228 length:1083 start_codon:yes stop_codon:yes gene_type:complete
MTEQFCISVIVPFYNAEKHIKTCLDALFKQDFNKPFEIIMVDDASNDNSREIVKSYNSSNIQLYSLNSNSGPSAARNIGLKKAKGKYVYFLDVDDTIESNTLKILYSVLNEKDYDLVFSDKKWIENSKNQRNNIFDYSSDQAFGKLEFEEVMRKRFHDPLSTGKFFGLTGRLIKNSIIKKNNILFEEKLRYLEDDTFMWDVLAFVRNARYIRRQLYSYHVHPNVNTALSEGLNRGFPISNFKLVRHHIQNSLKLRGFSNKEIEKIGDQGFIFFIISALISYSRSMIQGKIDLQSGKKCRKKIIQDILNDKEVSKAIRNYSRSKNESTWIPRAITWRSQMLLEFACTKRAEEILRIRKKLN